MKDLAAARGLLVLSATPASPRRRPLLDVIVKANEQKVVGRSINHRVNLDLGYMF